MNVRLLRRVAKHIAEEPRRYNQDAELEVDVIGRSAPACGTVGCIGGWVCALTGTTKRSRQKFSFERAMKQLGLTSAQAGRLFAYTWASGGWPERFKDAYRAATTPRQRVKVAVARIEHFIKTKGAE
jgi:hypothetical protein